MAGVGADRPPYWTAHHLAQWCAEYADYLDGRCFPSPGREATTARRWLNFGWSVLVDMSIGATANPVEVIKALRQGLGEPVPMAATWGTGSRAEEGVRAMMAISGGPAPLRDPPPPAQE